eukprot:670093-Rhodomonas_salina.1
MDVALDQIELFDKFCLLNWEQWVTKGWAAVWEEELGHLLGWKDPEVPRDDDADADDEGEVDEELIPLQQQEALYAKMEEYDTLVAYTGGRAVHATLDAGVSQDA